MSTLEQIEKAVSALSPTEAKEFASWFSEFHGDLWDKQMMADVEAGHLDSFLKDAKAEIASGKLSDL